MVAQFAFEVPVCTYLATIISILFSFYRIYLTVQSVFGLNLNDQIANQ